MKIGFLMPVLAFAGFALADYAPLRPYFPWEYEGTLVISRGYR